MNDKFCNQCVLSDGAPQLMAELLGVENSEILYHRYKQMRDCYDYTQDEWNEAFTDDLHPYGDYDDTTSVIIPIGKSYLGDKITELNKGAIGVDLPTWFNIQENNEHIMIIAQDPLRSINSYGECYDAVVSSPFGMHSLMHRQNG